MRQSLRPRASVRATRGVASILEAPAPVTASGRLAVFSREDLAIRRSRWREETNSSGVMCNRVSADQHGLVAPLIQHAITPTFNIFDACDLVGYSALCGIWRRYVSRSGYRAR